MDHCRCDGVSWEVLGEICPEVGFEVVAMHGENTGCQKMGALHGSSQMVCTLTVDR